MNGVRHRRGEANRRPDFILPLSHTRDTYKPRGGNCLGIFSAAATLCFVGKIAYFAPGFFGQSLFCDEKCSFLILCTLGTKISLLLPLSSDKHRRQRIREKSLKGFHSGFWAPAISDPNILPFGQQLVLPQSGHQAPGLIAHFPSLAWGNSNNNTPLPFPDMCTEKPKVFSFSFQGNWGRGGRTFLGTSGYCSFPFPSSSHFPSPVSSLLFPSSFSISFFLA